MGRGGSIRRCWHATDCTPRWRRWPTAPRCRRLTLYLTDNPTQAFVYITDTVDALVSMLDTGIQGPLDIAGPALPLSEFAGTAIALAGTGWLESTPPGAVTDAVVPEPHPHLEQYRLAADHRPAHRPARNRLMDAHRRAYPLGAKPRRDTGRPSLDHCVSSHCTLTRPPARYCLQTVGCGAISTNQ
ncbi:hypothetical protein GCM10011588_48490 [Nocardia jinanensis]|uniref:Uncharacterized protein n=1 Tax=Nocardia jinanensis TaxID=382504 RepID=A0A917RSR5_9NOCA|nr:hypothetical protein GCM10011588_48490 [Nocardia jinanensis]